MRVSDQCFWQSSAFDCAWSNPIVPVCLRSVKFFRVRVQCCIVLACIGFLRKYVIAHAAVLGQIPLHRARLSAFGQVLSCSRASMRRKYQIPQLKDERTVACFSDLENLQRSARNLLIQTPTLEVHKNSNKKLEAQKTF